MLPCDCRELHTLSMPRTRMDELYDLAEEHDGLLTSRDARRLGIKDSVLARLAQRGRLERASRGVYRIALYPTSRLGQYREAILWAQAGHHGPVRIALSHETALSLYNVSDVNPSLVHLTVPKSARLRRESPAWITIHRADLTAQETGLHEGMPITTIERSIIDVLSTTRRADIARQAVSDALKEGLLSKIQASGLRRHISRFTSTTSASEKRSKEIRHASTTI